MTTDTLSVPALSASGPAPGLSLRYQFYSTIDLLNPLIKDGWSVSQAFQVRSRKFNPYGKHLVRLTHPKLQLGADRLEAIVRNSHDGRSKLEFMLGAWRCVCSNGLILGTSFSHSIIPHLKTFEYVQERAYELIERAPQIASVFDAWKVKQLSRDEQHALAVAAALIRWGNKKKAPVDPDTLLEVRRPEDRGDNLWVTFNRVQEAVMTGGVARLNDRRTTRRIAGIDRTIEINKRLWQAGEQLYAGNNGPRTASIEHLSPAKQSLAKQSLAKQSLAKQSRAEQSAAEPSTAQKEPGGAIPQVTGL